MVTAFCANMLTFVPLFSSHATGLYLAMELFSKRYSLALHNTTKSVVSSVFSTATLGLFN